MEVQRVIQAHQTLIITLQMYMLYRRWKKRNYTRRFWVRDIYQKRRVQGYFSNLIQEMRNSDAEKHFTFFRMSSQQFDHILYLIEGKIQKQDTNFRVSITPAERLALTLRFLSSGDMQVSLSFGFRLGQTTVSNIIKETCKAIWDVLAPIYVKMPATEIEWLKVSEGFLEEWNLPNCVGAIDGKHVLIEKPSNSGSMFYNYKGTFSTVLLAVCDAFYRFLMVDVGSYGSQSDGGIFANSQFGIKLKNDDLKIPKSNILPGSNTEFPFYIVGDEAFPLAREIMRPYAGHGDLEQTVYNYRISRARRVIENTFGILVARWRIFTRAQLGTPENVDGIVQACVCLHNYLMTNELGELNGKKYSPENFVDNENAKLDLTEGDWRKTVQFSAIRDFNEGGKPNRHTRVAGNLRDILKNYLCNEGAVPWQVDQATKK